MLDNYFSHFYLFDATNLTTFLFDSHIREPQVDRDVLGIEMTLVTSEAYLNTILLTLSECKIFSVEN